MGLLYTFPNTDTVVKWVTGIGVIIFTIVQIIWPKLAPYIEKKSKIKSDAAQSTKERLSLYGNQMEELKKNIEQSESKRALESAQFEKHLEKTDEKLDTLTESNLELKTRLSSLENDIADVKSAIDDRNNKSGKAANEISVLNGKMDMLLQLFSNGPWKNNKE